MREFMKRSVIHEDNLSGTQLRAEDLSQSNAKLIDIGVIIEVK
jgi:hypothetical protein